MNHQAADRSDVFVAYSTGLFCRQDNDGHRGLVKIEINRSADRQQYRLLAVSGKNLVPMRGAKVVTLSATEWEARPIDTYNDLVEAKWLMDKCGWHPAGLPGEDDDQD